MAGEKLQAFKELKETTENSLNETEKTNLNKINAADIRAEKAMIGDKTFKIDGQDMKLKDIVTKLKISTDGRTATLNGKQIAKISELGAAIQVYVIANDKGVGSTKIDGWVGKNTIMGIQSAQNSIKAETGRTPDKPGQNIENLDNIDEILTKNLLKYFGDSAEQKKYSETYKILDTNTGKLKGTLDNTNKKLVVSYDSVYDSYDGQKHKTVRISFEDFLNDDKTVDTNKLVKSLKDAIGNSEVSEKGEYYKRKVENGIKDYKETSISDPLLKKYFESTKPDFKLDKVYYSNKDKCYYARIKNDKNDKWGKRDIDVTKMLKGGEFNVGQYAGELVKLYKDNAIAHERTRLKNSTNSAKSLGDTNSRTEKYRGIIAEIDALPDKPDNYKKLFMNERNEAVRQLNYETFNNSLINVENEIYNKNLTQDQRIKKLQTVVYAGKENGRRVVDYDNSVTKHFEKVGKKADYLTRTKKLAKYVFGSGNYVEQNG